MFDVAIVGYGPAGVVLAGLLGQAGLSVHVCDRMRGVYEIPRAISLDHEILRVFQQLGVVDAVLPHTEPFTNSEWFGADSRLIRRMTMLPPPHPQGYTPSVVFTQPAVERVLRERVAQMPNVQVALGTEALGFEQDAEGVTLQLRSDGSEGGGASADRSVRARWLVACDGGSSRLRSLAGIALEDLGFDEPWLVVDVNVNERGLARLPKTSVQYCEPARPCTMVIGPGHHRRWEISLKPGEDPQQASTPEGTWALLARWLTPAEGTLWRQASYRFHALVAERWRAGPARPGSLNGPGKPGGRFFVAGDAAHMQPPFLGQGMCQGVRDVANLAWKLAAVAKGEVSGAEAEALLDSYGHERQAHVRELTTRLKAIGSIICERDGERARARDQRLLAECDGVVKDTPRQDVLPRLDPGPGLGLLSVRDSSGRGTLFPQPRLESPEGGAAALMDGRFGTGWRLVLDAGLDGVSPETPVPPDVAVVALSRPGSRETEGVVAAWMQRHGCRAALVRPDHYVFGTAEGAEGLRALLAERAAMLGH